MYRIRKIKFINHPILRNLELDFCTPDGKAVNTVILAGENGTGKSTILNYIYGLFSGSVFSESELELEHEDIIIKLYFVYDKRSGRIWVRDNNGMNTLPGNDDFKKKYPLSGIYSDVDINFRAQSVSTVTSLNIDESKDSRRSNTELPKQIKQLLIDVQALDDSDLARAFRSNPDKTKSQLEVPERMPRFTEAFAHMFDDLRYDRIENKDGHKEIYFKKQETDISIDNLSSGEKQVVYRGCFLLKDVNATKGAFAFIDEPEISLHPSWQKKIMEYYKGIFSDESGEQSSQIFVVTHSPFVIHNESRRNDKVIILSRDTDGNIIVKDKPDYYKCNSIEVVHDAFCIDDFSAEVPTVYLEGRTDEIYFNKALEVYGMTVPFKFKWIGYIDEKGEEANTGKDALNKAVQFLLGRNLPIKNICLYDCDTNKTYKEVKNVISMSIKKYENDKGINIGIENALVFGDFDIEPYRKQRVEVDGYGIEKRIPDFQKMSCCRDVCSLDTKQLESVFANLKTIIEQVEQIFQKK